ncbi:MAG TPA: serine hydrolase domain-containing protein [Alphaproteobacteria bacterium]|nr:serine hydrolase domain-containing protein [Alphaproteobacteria bacterium]
MEDKKRAGGLSKKRLKRLADGMAAYVERGEVAGIVTLIHRDGEEVHFDAVGWQDGERRIPIERDSIFRIASMTKPVASVAALMLLEEGKLRLDDPIDNWLPELANRSVLHDPKGPLAKTYKAPRPITVLDLMTHRPGFASQFIDLMGPIGKAVAKLHVGNGLLLLGTDVDEWLARLGALPLVHVPGERMNYGFTTDVLGFLVGRAAGKPLEGFLAERLFEPLGMRDTAFHVPKAKRGRLCVAYATDLKSGKRVVDDHPRESKWASPPKVPSASAGLVSTADDYAKFGRMLLAGGKLGRERILSRKTIELMTTDFLTPAQRRMLFMGFPMWKAQGFGLGVSVKDRLGGQASLSSVGTYGWGGAYGTWWFNDPKERITAVMMTQLLVGTLGSKLAPDFTNLVYQAIDD